MKMLLGSKTPVLILLVRHWALRVSVLAWSVCPGQDKNLAGPQFCFLSIYTYLCRGGAEHCRGKQRRKVTGRAPPTLFGSKHFSTVPKFTNTMQQIRNPEINLTPPLENGVLSMLLWRSHTPFQYLPYPGISLSHILCFLRKFLVITMFSNSLH